MAKVRRQERVERLRATVEQISSVVRRLHEATSNHRGVDCAAHAMLGRALLQDSGFDAKLVVGYAAWRIGSAGHAAISHVAAESGHLLPGTQGFAYHAWLQCDERIIDLTTYQLTRKARALDAIDGGHTLVEWCPSYLMIGLHRTQTYKQVQQSLRAGVVYYEPRPELLARFEGTNTFVLDNEDLICARRLLANPNLGIAGPNNIIDDRATVSEQLQKLERLMEVLGPENVPGTTLRVAQHLRARQVPLTHDEEVRLVRLMDRVARSTPHGDRNEFDYWQRATSPGRRDR